MALRFGWKGSALSTSAREQREHVVWPPHFKIFAFNVDQIKTQPIIYNPTPRKSIVTAILENRLSVYSLSACRTAILYRKLTFRDTINLKSFTGEI